MKTAVKLNVAGAHEALPSFTYDAYGRGADHAVERRAPQVAPSLRWLRNPERATEACRAQVRRAQGFPGWMADAAARCVAETYLDTMHALGLDTPGKKALGENNESVVVTGDGRVIIMATRDGDLDSPGFTGGGGGGTTRTKLGVRLPGSNTRRWALAAGAVAPVQRMRLLTPSVVRGTVLGVDIPRPLSAGDVRDTPGVARGRFGGGSGGDGRVSDGGGTVAAAAAASATSAAAVARSEARQSRVDSLTASVHLILASGFVLLCWAVMGWFALEFGTRTYDWIGPSEEPHFLATFALALLADSLVIELRGALGFLLHLFAVHGRGSEWVTSGDAPTPADGWFERWLDAASLGAMRRRGGVPYSHARAWGRSWAWLAYWANVDDHTVP